MDTSGRKVFRFEGFALDQIRGSLSNGSQEIDLRPKTFAVLQFLVENAGHLLSKDEILRAVWPNVIVTEDSLVRCVHEARLALGDSDQRLIRTVPRRGYLFDVPVIGSEEKAAQVFAPVEAGLHVSNAMPAVAPGRTSSARGRRMMWPTLAVATLMVALVGASIFAWHSPSGPAMPIQPSIAVLPFANLSGDPRQDFFSDGISEDLITNLSSFSDLFVIARNSSFAYRGKTIRANRVGRDLGVRYLLEGSVRRDGQQLRITAQLVDAQAEKQLWAKRYDRAWADVFAVQDLVTQEIVATLASSVRLADVTRMSRVPAGDLLAYELVLRAREVSFRTSTRESTLEARELARRAIMIDPTIASAYVELGRTYYRAFALEWDGPGALDLASDAAQRAISMDQSSASAYELLGRVHLRRGRHDAAIAILQKAISLNPNRADSYASLGDALTFAGRAAEAVPLLEKTIRLDPFYPPQIDMYLGRALYFAKRYDQAELSLDQLVHFVEPPVLP
ncbi:MAG: tetratricopeptide repeat protein [Alphaproteobacteria bacterium]|nr:tetratricopeptide repeat protein [Alphaproteobacteria bacterium]